MPGQTSDELNKHLKNKAFIPLHPHKRRCLSIF